jgi:hypothetical protein
MDHIPKPQGKQQSSIEIPYICGEGFRYDTTTPFAQYEADLDHFKGLQHGEHSGSKDKAALIMQKWLFFGVINVFFGTANIAIETDDFVRRDENGRSLITTHLLEELLSTWVENIKLLTLEARTAAAKTIEDCLRRSQISTKYWGSTSEPLLSRITLSVTTLGATLAFAQRHVFRSGGSCPLPGWDDQIRYRGWTKCRLLVDQLTSSSWCPYEIAQLYSGSFSTIGLSFAASLDRPQRSKSHGSCDEKRCVAIQVDESTYETKHVDDQCDCEHLEAHHDKTCSILHSGGIPVIRISRSEYGSSIQTDVVKYGPGIQFVAISHVWADRLGNVRANSLPQCQLNRLHNLVYALHPESQSVFVWIDTLCVPTRHHAAACANTVGTLTCRKVAIGRLKQTYENASKVLVLDWELQQSLSTTSAEESLMRIVISVWMKRLWTFQEARLAKALFIQFSDRAVEMRDMLYKLNMSDYQSLWAEIADVIIGTRGILENVGDAQKLAFFWNSLQGRSTSNAGDEAVCLAIMLGLDNKKILDTPDDERMLELFSMQDIIPSQILFMPGPRIQKHGYRWAPTSFLGRQQWTAATGLGDNLLPHAEVHTINAQCAPAYRADSGLLMRSPGFLLLPSEEPLYHAFMLVDADEQFHGLAVYLKDDNNPSWNEMCVQKLGDLGLIIDSHIPRGGAILAVLVSNCQMERGIIFARYECRIWFGGSSGGETLPTAETKIIDESSGVDKSQVARVTTVKPGQMWCVA